MTLEQIAEIKKYLTERADYFSRIDFPILQKDYQTAINFASELEETIKLNLELVARIQALEAQIQTGAQEDNNGKV